MKGNILQNESLAALDSIYLGNKSFRKKFFFRNATCNYIDNFIPVTVNDVQWTRNRVAKIPAYFNPGIGILFDANPGIPGSGSGLSKFKIALNFSKLAEK